MHGRQAMLATVGFVFPSLVGKLPVGWAADVSTNPIAAQYEVRRPALPASAPLCEAAATPLCAS